MSVHGKAAGEVVMMHKLTLKRFHSDENGVAGVLEVGDKVFYTLERPWVHNSRNISCIPEGFYLMKPHAWEQDSSARFKMVWELQDVPNRTYILIHAGNYTKDTNGCILIGKGISVNDGNKMVTNSRTALNELRKIIGVDSAVISIESA